MILEIIRKAVFPDVHDPFIAKDEKLPPEWVLLYIGAHLSEKIGHQRLYLGKGRDLRYDIRASGN